MIIDYCAVCFSIILYTCTYVWIQLLVANKSLFTFTLTTGKDGIKCHPPCINKLLFWLLADRDLDDTFSCIFGRWTDSLGHAESTRNYFDFPCTRFSDFTPRLALTWKASSTSASIMSYLPLTSPDSGLLIYIQEWKIWGERNILKDKMALFINIHCPVKPTCLAGFHWIDLAKSVGAIVMSLMDETIKISIPPCQEDYITCIL